MPFLRKEPRTGPVATGTVADRSVDRRSMVDLQLKNRGIRDPAVLEAMERIPRDAFVLAADRGGAYDDRPLHIGHGATISQPYIVALMTEALELGPRDRVLEVGTGSGYQTAILARLAREVFTIEIVPDLAERARLALRRQGIANVRFRTGDGRKGWPDEAPFDAVVLTAAPVRLPGPLLAQLGPGGRLVAPVGDLDQRLVLWRRSPSGLARTDLTYVRFVPLQGEEDS